VLPLLPVQHGLALRHHECLSARTLEKIFRESHATLQRINQAGCAGIQELQPSSDAIQLPQQISTLHTDLSALAGRYMSAML
jgi:hypothetical protein